MGVLGWGMSTQQHVNLLGWGSSFQEGLLSSKMRASHRVLGLSRYFQLRKS